MSRKLKVVIIKLFEVFSVPRTGVEMDQLCRVVEDTSKER